MVELIHCHIPKTGGVSFLEILKRIYGDDQIAFPWTWVDMVPEQGKGFNMLWYKWPELYKLWQARIPEIVEKKKKVKVLQGHFPVRLFNGLYPNAKRIAWVRHPVARVISHYTHDMAKKHQPRMSLDKYIYLPHNRNVMAFHIGHDIDNMDWIGVLETIDKDIEELAIFLGWGKIPRVPHLNKSNKKPVAERLGKKIAELNEKDMQIYAEVLARKPGEVYYA